MLLHYPHHPLRLSNFLERQLKGKSKNLIFLGRIDWTTFDRSSFEPLVFAV
jgi:hypothetical protein